MNENYLQVDIYKKMFRLKKVFSDLIRHIYDILTK